MENFPNSMTEKVTQIQESEKAPIKRNPKRPTPRNIIIKMGKIQRQRENLRGSKGHTGSNIQGSPDKGSS